MKIMDEIIVEKIKKTVELICFLYRKDLIVDTYIVGSVAKGNAVKESDIDLYLIHPEFEESINLEKPEYLLSIIKDYSSSQKEEILERLKTNIELANTLIADLNVQFIVTESNIEGVSFWHQLYKDELFHIMIAPDISMIDVKNGIRITEKDCI